MSAGTLFVTNTSGSATGTGAVAVDAGVLAGDGVIAGAVTIGTGAGSGAALAPANGKINPATLTLQSSLSFASDSTYNNALNTNQPKDDEVLANGVTIDGGAMFVLRLIGDKTLSAGTVFTVINNSTSTPIDGSFANLADGAIIVAGSNSLQANYEGGDGNNLTLTVTQ